MASTAEGAAHLNPTHIDIGEAKKYLASLIDRVQAGEDVVIDRDGKPSVRLTPVGAMRPTQLDRAPRVLGTAVGEIQIGEGFDDPVPGFEEFYE